MITWGNNASCCHVRALNSGHTEFKRFNDLHLIKVYAVSKNEQSMLKLFLSRSNDSIVLVLGIK